MDFPPPITGSGTEEAPCVPHMRGFFIILFRQLRLLAGAPSKVASGSAISFSQFVSRHAPIFFPIMSVRFRSLVVRLETSVAYS
jgi:hypothetical protein